MQILTVLSDSPISRKWPHVVHRNPFHPDVRKRMVAWRQECDTSHAQCRSSSNEEPLLPSRVLDLNGLPSSESCDDSSTDWKDSFNEKQVQLVITNNGQRGGYIALSYCWGSALPCKTTTENVQKHMKGIAMENLPRTLQESIMVTRMLGVRYIWIDCLCELCLSHRVCDLQLTTYAKHWR